MALEDGHGGRKYRIPEIVTEVIKKWDEAKTHHDPFVTAWERRERAYRGILSVASDAAKWRHKYAPKYAFNLIETIVANTVEMGLRFDVRPSPRPHTDLETAMQMLEQAEVVGEVLRSEHRIDGMDFKQRPLFLSAAIGGVGIGKSSWTREEGPVRKQAVAMEPVYGPNDEVLLEVPVVREVTDVELIRDHSTFEVVDPRDFVMHESAKALQPWEPGGAQYLFHRCWYSFEQLKVMEADGFLKNVDLLKESLSFEAEYADREKQLWEINREKDLIEVLEYWCFKNGQVHRCLVGNRVVLLRELEDVPFSHRGYPFVLCSSMPQLFNWRGVSDVELIEQLQEILWEIQNQTLDNVELINNFILLVDDAVDDPESFEHYPGARWPGNPQLVQPLQPPYQLADVTLRHQALIKGDLQNVTSAAPFASGAETATVDQKTATGAAIVMNAAQQRLVAKKYQAQQALREEANMRIKNCQQFITDKRLIHIVGEDGAQTFREIEPLAIQGEFLAELEPLGESQMRQERRAEGVQWFTSLIQAAPLMAAAGAPMNMREVFASYAKLWGHDDWQRFLSLQPQPTLQGGQAGSEGASGTAPPEAPTPNLGITAPAAPGAEVGASPATALTRALQMGGGANNL